MSTNNLPIGEMYVANGDAMVPLSTAAAGVKSAARDALDTYSKAEIAGTSGANVMDAVGQLTYGGTDGAITKLAAQIVATKKFLTETGAAGQAPAWALLADSDLPAGTLKHAKVALSAADIAAMYGAPVEILAAPGAGVMISVERYMLRQIHNTTAYANGGAIQLQYKNTTHAGGVAVGATIAATVMNDAATQSAVRTVGDHSGFADSVVEDAGIFISNATGAFDTGDGTAEVDIWYREVVLT